MCHITDTALSPDINTLYLKVVAAARVSVIQAGEHREKE
jgi:hypothetical protein